MTKSSKKRKELEQENICSPVGRYCVNIYTVVTKNELFIVLFQRAGGGTPEVLFSVAFLFGWLGRGVPSSPKKWLNFFFFFFFFFSCFSNLYFTERTRRNFIY